MVIKPKNKVKIIHLIKKMNYRKILRTGVKKFFIIKNQLLIKKFIFKLQLNCALIRF